VLGVRGYPKPILTLPLTVGIIHKYNTGQWSAEEHDSFIEGLKAHGRDWTKLVNIVKTRSKKSIQNHATNYDKGRNRPDSPTPSMKSPLCSHQP
jgi:hypothetical protein